MIDVLIVGAGPAGLTLACDLRRRGVAFRLIEKLPSPLVGSKGKGIQPRSLELFDDLGLIDRVFANSSNYPPMRIYKGPDPVATHIMMPILEPTPDVPYPNIRMQPQWKTEALLRERLAELGGQVEFNTSFKSLEQTPQAVVVKVLSPAGEETVSARYVVAADGGRGTIRKAIGVTFEGENPSLDGILIADVKVEGLGRDVWHVWTTPAGQKVTLCPLPPTDGFQFAAFVTEGAEPVQELETLQALLDEAAGPRSGPARKGLSKLLGRRASLKGSGYRVSDMTWISLFRPNVRMANAFRKGRVFLVGDAAHIHTPAGAQGLNTSIQDAYNLGWKLGWVIKGVSDARLLDTYEEERLPIAAAVLRRSDELYKDIVKQDGKEDRNEDDGQLTLNYRGSSLCGPANVETLLQPGDRMPNILLRSPSGATLNLFDLMRGPQASEFHIDRVRPEGASTKDIRVASIGSEAGARGFDYHGDGPAMKDLAGRIVSVRPDGYIQSIGDKGSLPRSIHASAA
uniref:Monooxygenase FAD-binding n=1 Tax=Caulobacter sp. (strain K31) TaxID=366602 RepID=B0T7D7_CAUSK